MLHILACAWLVWVGQVVAASDASLHKVPDTMAQRLQACTGCHGAEGRASNVGYLPRIAGKPQTYLVNQLRAFRDGQRIQPAMQHLLRHWTDDYIEAAATYFAQLDLPYPSAPIQLPSTAAMRRGASLVREGDPERKIPACSRCHGDALMGVAPAIPGLLGLPKDYLVGQLGAWKAGKRHTQSPDCMAQVAERLRVDDVSAVATWLAAQPVPVQTKPARMIQQPLPLSCGVFKTAAAASTAQAANTAMVPTTPLVAQGAYLARVGNCAGCHTARGGAAYAGGVGIVTPFGTVFAGNLTPDATTGLGGWSAEDFWNALHLGRSKDGRWLNPAFPYTSYTHIQRADSDALFAYLQTLAPVRQAQAPGTLTFPFNTQWALRVWRSLFFQSGGWVSQTQRSPEWNRGAYLVRGLGHCAECHAPRNRRGGSEQVQALAGGWIPLQNWWASPLGLGPIAGDVGAQTAAWMNLLRTGQSSHRSLGGPMAEVVSQSTQYLRAEDARAMALYLQSVPTPPRLASAAAAPVAVLQKGQPLYRRHCADCHGEQGQGARGVYPALAGNAGVLQAQPANLVRRVLDGGFAPVTTGNPRPYGMPPYRHLLDTDQLAAVLTFVRQSWGNQAGLVTPVDVMQAQ